jgi:ribosomal protein S21
MGAKVFPRHGETIEQLLQRFRVEVAKDRVGNKWPKYRGFHAKPSAIEHRRRWIKAMKRRLQLRRV